jgi:hypothetical protein
LAIHPKALLAIAGALDSDPESPVLTSLFRRLLCAESVLQLHGSPPQPVGIAQGGKTRSSRIGSGRDWFLRVRDLRFGMPRREFDRHRQDQLRWLVSGDVVFSQGSLVFEPYRAHSHDWPATLPAAR